MQTSEFLQRILPPAGSGTYCWATPAPPNRVGLRFSQHFGRVIDFMAERVVALDQQQVNTYYAMASFKKGGTRSHENVDLLKAFWIDIDCGAEKAESGKGYVTKRDGVTALLQACRTLDLPDPMLVDSGNGIHAYWPTSDTMEPLAWKRVARQLIVAFQSQGLIADYQTVDDESRILRPVGTHNWKDPDNPKPVKLLRDCPDYTFEDIAERVADYPVEEPAVATVLGGLNADLDIQYDSEPADANLIADECAHMARMRGTRGDIPEPEWRNCLGVLKHCEDGERIAQEWSSGHPHYSIRDTAKKLAQRKAPTRCETFAKDNKNLCTACIHRGNISSPIQLGRSEKPSEAAEPDEPGVTEQVVEEKVTAVAPPPLSRERIVAALSEFVIPAPLDLTYRWAKDQMWVAKGEGSVAITEQFIVCDGLVEIDREMHMHLRVRMRNGVVREVDMPASAVKEEKTCAKFLASRGISATNGKDKEMVTYMHQWFDKVRRDAEEARQHTHFGWQADGSFLVGTRLYRDGHEPRKASVAAELSRTAGAFTLVGEPETWKQVVAKLYSGPGMEQYYFMLGVAFGAPLMKLLGMHGTIFSALSESGFGKTACETVMLAVWGDPVMLMRSYKGMTVNSLHEHIALLNSLPVVIDEVSMAKPEAISDMAYDVTNGQPKQRLNRDGTPRDTKPVWYTLVQTSSNFSLWEKLGAGRVVSDAQWLRMLEFRVRKNFVVDAADARALTAEIVQCQGVVGDQFIQHVVDNQVEVKAMLETLHKRLDAAAEINAAERFWSAGVTAVIAGLHIAKQLGLIEVDVQAVTKWAVNQIKEARASLLASSPPKDTILKSVINDINGHIIITDSLGQMEGDAKVYARPAHNEVWGRLVTEENALWVTQQCIRDWCAKKATNYRMMVEGATAAGLIEKEEVFALGAGTEFPSAAVKCFRLNWLKLQTPDVGTN